MQKSHQATTPSSNLYREVNVVMVITALLLGVRLLCAVWAILASLRKHLRWRCLCVVHSSLIMLRCGSLDQND